MDTGGKDPAPVGANMDFGASQPRSVLSWKYALVPLLGGLILTAAWLLAAVWQRATVDFEPEWVSQAAASHPMRLSPLIAGDNRAKGGESVYLTRVLLKPGPAPKMFFLVGSQGTEILTVAQTAHMVAAPGDTVNVKGTVRITPSLDILRKKWNLSPADASVVSQTAIYIESQFIREDDD